MKKFEVTGHSKLAAFTWNPDTNKVILSDGLTRLLQYRKNDHFTFEEFTQKILHPDDFQRVTKWLEKKSESQKITSSTTNSRFIKKNGETVHMEISIRISPPGNMPKQIFAICFDLSNRKKAAKSLGELNIHFVTFIENTTDFIYFKDKESRFIFCSQTLAEITNHKSWRDMIGKHDFEVFPEETARVYYEEELPVFTKGTPLLNKIDPYFDKNGKPGWVITNKWPVFDPETRKVTGIFGISRDITERINIENKLKESEDRFKKFFRESSSVMLLIEPFDGKIIDANDAAITYYGYKVEKLLKMTIQQINTLPAEKVAEERTRALHEDRNYFRFKHKLANGEIRDVEVYSNPVVSGGHNLLFSIIHDITARHIAEKTLKESEAKYRTLFENLSVGLVMYEKKGKIIAANEAATKILHMSFDELYHRPSVSPKWIAMHEDETSFNARNYPVNISMETGRPCKNVVMGLVFENETFWININTQPLFKENESKPYAVIAAFLDITESKRAEQKLILADNVFRNAREGILITDPKGNIIEINNAFMAITGYSRDEIIGNNPRMLKSGKHDSLFYEDMWNQLLKKGHWSGEISNRKKNGENYTEQLNISAIRNKRGEVLQYVGLFSDITYLKEHEKQLEQIAHYDPLTKLPNRILLADRLRTTMAQTIRSKKVLAVAYIDLDGFKEINDSHGHDVGDKLLIEISHKMRDVLRQGDTISRLGGDEFVVVLFGLKDKKESYPVLKRILDAASQPVQYMGLILQVSASIGVTFYPQNENIDADQLLRQSDLAMYQAKVAGKNRYHLFDIEQDRTIKGFHEGINQVQNGLSNNEFVLYYQPLVNIHTGEIFGAEALIRWKHTKKGLLQPAEFLSIIEKTPVAVNLGNWVISQALTQIEEWNRLGLNLKVSVNLCPDQLQSENFLDNLKTELEKHPYVNTDQLQLEIVESSALADIERASKVIIQCKEIGVRFSLDDFGTGYSSLSCLKRLPVAFLKIDQSFVRDMLEDSDDLAILEGVIGLATAFRLEAVAEGVESEEQGVLLLQLGCKLAQGHYIAPPMLPDQLLQWQNEWQLPESWKLVERINRDDFPVVNAGVEHRAWIQGIEQYLEGLQSVEPELNVKQCRFGLWIEEFGKEKYKNIPEFSVILDLHTKIHNLVDETLRMHKSDSNENHLIKLNMKKLITYRDKLLILLQQLINEKTFNTGSQIINKP